MSIGLKIFLIVSLSLTFTVMAQSNSVLDEYVKEGLENNIVIKQKKINYEKAALSLRSATSLFFPSIGIVANYTDGEGGRNISIPVGDLMNPVYKTLNQLTNSNSFPQISNVEENFFPNKFYDAKIRLSMPILNTDIIYNRDIKEEEKKIKGYDLESYKRELIKEIKIAYYNYLTTVEAVNIYKASQDVANQAKRVTESLLKNGAALPVYVLRAETEIENLKSKLTEMEAKSFAAKKYFNFLINRNLDENIKLEENRDLDLILEEEKDFIALREEIKMLDGVIEVNKSILSMNKSFWIPKINGFIDLGAQDSKWNYSNKSRYHLFGVQLEIPLFEGFRNINKIETASLDIKEAELELEKTKKVIALAVSISKDEINSALQNYNTAVKQLKTAETYSKLIEKGYKEGVNTFLETIDSRSQLTSAKLMVSINKYAVQIAKAKFERETSTAKLLK